VAGKEREDGQKRPIKKEVIRGSEEEVNLQEEWAAGGKSDVERLRESRSEKRERRGQ
jgi:hypothetical protein